MYSETRENIGVLVVSLNKMSQRILWFASELLQKKGVLRSEISYWVLFILNAWSWYPLWGTLIYSWSLSLIIQFNLLIWPPINPRGLHKTKENRIYSRGEYILEKSVKRPLLLYCYHTASVLHIFMLYNLLALEYHFIKNLKLILKENQIMK